MERGKMREVMNQSIDRSPSKAKYSLAEEIANSITHGIGIVFSIVTLTILLVYAIWKKSGIAIVGFSIYGLCSIILYTSSTLYHSFQKKS